jgi:hypothetical protein
MKDFQQSGGGFTDRGPINERSQNRVILKIPSTPTQKGGVYYLFGDKIKNLQEEGDESFPFQIKTFVQGRGYEASVNPGTLNNLLPTNLFANDVLTRFSYQENSIQHVILKGLSNGKQFTSCNIIVQSQAPPAQPPTLFGLPEDVEILLGAVYNRAVYQLVKTRLELVGKQLFLKDRDEPAEPGQLPYEAYFVWA